MAQAARYPEIADYGLIGDCHSAALVSRRGSIDWCCLPRFDSGSAFARILDHDRGGFCSVEPQGDGPWEWRRRYLEDTLVLETRLVGPSGSATIHDCFIIHEPGHPAGRRQIVRLLTGERGALELELRVAPRFDYGGVRPWIRRHGYRLHTMTGGNDALVVWSEQELDEDPHHELRGTVKLGVGDRIRLSLTYVPPEQVAAGDVPEAAGDQLDEALQRTIAWWREWASTVSLNSRDEQPVRRSALVLKALTFEQTGAVVAAPTTSLPEVMGGQRNWDYRFAWIRDSSFSSRAFAELGCVHEANAFRAFIMRSAAGHAEDLQVFYGIGGERRISQDVIEELEGYGGSSPVRIGNGARTQRQFDAYGELVNLTWRWHRRGHSPDDDDWRFLLSLIDQAAERCGEPDNGIWEWPGEPEHFVHSKVMCWAALNRGLMLAEECMRRAPVRRWRKVRDELRETIEERGYDDDRGVFVQSYDRQEMDAALLLLPTVEFVAWDDERMIRTTKAVQEELEAAPGLLYRYRRRDGLPGREGAFLCCSFWLAETLARQGEISQAREIFDRTIGAANDLGLLSEEIDPRTLHLLGNFPQGLTHLAHIDAAVCLAEVERAI